VQKPAFDFLTFNLLTFKKTNMQNALFCIWSEEVSPKKYFQALLDKQSENQATLKVGISTLRNGRIESLYADDAETLLAHPPL
jgi:hypothetical protein